jgi:hypothetical protein
MVKAKPNAPAMMIESQWKKQRDCEQQHDY